MIIICIIQSTMYLYIYHIHDITDWHCIKLWYQTTPNLVWYQSHSLVFISFLFFSHQKQPQQQQHFASPTSKWFNLSIEMFVFLHKLKAEVTISYCFIFLLHFLQYIILLIQTNILTNTTQNEGKQKTRKANIATKEKTN